MASATICDNCGGIIKSLEQYLTLKLVIYVEDQGVVGSEREARTEKRLDACSATCGAMLLEKAVREDTKHSRLPRTPIQAVMAEK